MTMKITAVEALPLAMPFRYARDRQRTLDFCLVRVDTDGGLTGWGEAFSYGCRNAVAAAVNAMVAPLALGWEVGRAADLHLHLQRKLHIFGRFGITAFAISGLDIALWDIAGKAAGVPVSKLLGGARRNSIPCYASLLRYADPTSVAHHAARALEEGYGAIKLHEVTLPAVAEARAAIGNATPLMLDVNCEWTRQGAIDMARVLRPYALAWLEEPVFPPEDFAGLRAAGQASAIPVATGENLCFATQFEALREAGAAAFAQPSVTKVGGITEFLKVQQLGMALAPHSPYFGPGALATLHLLAASVLDARFEFYYGACEAPLFGDHLAPRQGALGVPQAPGLGADPDPEVLRRYRA
jgi:L-alanine-DL-glutamate epimerase-like enolase superfamily enzyme